MSLRLDNIMGPQGGLTAIGVLPNQGASAFLFSAVLDSVFKNNSSAAIFAPGTTRETTISRLVAMEAGLATEYISIMKPGLPDWPRLCAAAKKISSVNIWVDDSPGITVEEIYDRVEKVVKSGKKLGIIAVDDLQLIRIKRRPFRNGPGMGEELLVRLRDLALKIKAPLLLTFKVNSRGYDFLERSLPKKVKFSNAISKVADCVMLLSRNYLSYDYGPDLKGFIVKNNYGKTGSIFFKLDASGGVSEAKPVRKSAKKECL